MKPFSCPLYVSCEKYHYTLIFLKKKVLQPTLISLLSNRGEKSEKKSTFKRRPFLVNGSKVFDFNKKKKTQIKNDKTGLLYFRTSCVLGPEHTKKV